MTPRSQGKGHATPQTSRVRDVELSFPRAEAAVQERKVEDVLCDVNQMFQGLEASAGLQRRPGPWSKGPEEEQQGRTAQRTAAHGEIWLPPHPLGLAGT